jgi:diguanylate cyclase (GGDEF)-like protein
MHRLERLKVLVADDDQATLRFARGCLRLLPVDVETASAGHEAVQKLYTFAPDVLITDHHMPDVSGMEIISAVRSDPMLRSMYLIMMTWDQRDAMLPMAFDAGVDDFVTKPLDRVEFTARARAGLRIAQMAQDLRQACDDLARERAELQVENHNLQNEAARDELTGLANRRYGLRLINQARLCSGARAMSGLFMADVDRFKAINDTHGHDVGDKVLLAVSEALVRTLGSRGLVIRYGGEEFLGVTLGEGSSAELMEACREDVASIRIVAGAGEIRPTISVGLVDRPGNDLMLEDLVREADQAMYRSKREGRDRLTVVCSGCAGDRAA